MTDELLTLKIEKQPPLRKIVYERLKDAILTGVVAKGTKLYESKIAEDLGISRTPVREALHALERELLVDALDKVGYEVRDADLEDLEEISEIRRTVETLALRKAVSRIGDAEIRVLEENVSQAREAVEEGKPDLFVRLDAEFHRIIAASSRRERLIRMADTLRKEMHRFINRTRFNHALAKESLRYHEEILRFLKEKDYGKAKRALNDHISHARQEHHRALARVP